MFFFLSYFLFYTNTFSYSFLEFYMSIQRKKIQRAREHRLSIIEFIICNTDYRVYEVHVKYIDLLKNLKNRNFRTGRHWIICSKPNITLGVLLSCDKICHNSVLRKSNSLITNSVFIYYLPCHSKNELFISSVKHSWRASQNCPSFCF